MAGVSSKEREGKEALDVGEREAEAQRVRLTGAGRSWSRKSKGTPVDSRSWRRNWRL